MSEFYLIDNEGLYKKIPARPHLLFEDSALIIISSLDRKVYKLVGKKASEKKLEAINQLAENVGKRRNFIVEEISFPSENVKPEHIQFIEYFVDDLYLPRIKTIDSLKYSCYHCSGAIERNSERCPTCAKEVQFCFICNLPISFEEDIGRCSLCEATAHLVHFQEWIKSLGMCTKCNQKLHLEGIIPITKENKEKYFQ